MEEWVAVAELHLGRPEPAWDLFLARYCRLIRRSISFQRSRIRLAVMKRSIVER